MRERRGFLSSLLHPTVDLFLMPAKAPFTNIFGVLVTQVKFRSFAKLLFFLDPRPEDHLLVLGCGAGACVIASALLYDLCQIQAVDSIQARNA